MEGTEMDKTLNSRTYEIAEILNRVVTTYTLKVLTLADVKLITDHNYSSTKNGYKVYVLKITDKER